MTLFVEGTLFKIWKSVFEVQGFLETIIVVELRVLPESVRSVEIKTLMAYVAGEITGLRTWGWEMSLDLSKVGGLSQIGMNAKDEINYLVAGDR